MEHYSLTTLGLTSTQVRLLQFIRRYVAEKKESPTWAQMRDALGLRSKSGISRLVAGLAERGHIVYRPRRYRSISLTPVAKAATDLRVHFALVEILDAARPVLGDDHPAVAAAAAALGRKL